MIWKTFLAAVILIPYFAVADPVGAPSRSSPSETDPQILDISKYWQPFWPFDPAAFGLIHSIHRARAGQSLADLLRLEIAPGRPHVVTISLINGGKKIYSWQGHERSEFVTSLGEPLYYADFKPDAPGAAVVAVDQRTGAVLWRLQLEDIPGEHKVTPYFNSVALSDQGGVLLVERLESDGGYMEVIDVRKAKPRIYMHHLYQSTDTK
jgi:hypothetical protein